MCKVFQYRLNENEYLLEVWEFFHKYGNRYIRISRIGGEYAIVRKIVANRIIWVIPETDKMLPNKVIQYADRLLENWAFT